MPRKPSTSIAVRKIAAEAAGSTGLRFGFRRRTRLTAEHRIDQVGVLECREDQVRGTAGRRMRVDPVDDEAEQRGVRHRAPSGRR